MNMARNK